MQLSTPFLAAAAALTSLNQTQTTTPAILANLKIFSEYSAAAYCSANYLVPFNGTVICPTNICPLLPTVPSVQLADSFIQVSVYQTTGLILVDHTNNLLVFTFQGTHTARDWLTDLDFLLESADDICNGCEAHSGFLGSWRGVRSAVLNEWTSLRAKYPTYQTVVTGHSLGGAIANLCAAQMKQVLPSSNVYLFTYGSPRVGNEDFASYIETTLGMKNFRVTHLNDPVPRLPPRWTGFAHPGPEYFVTSPHIPGVLSADYSTLLEAKNLVVKPSDVFVLKGADMGMGNVKYTCTDPAMHSSYLGYISGCLGGSLSKDGRLYRVSSVCEVVVLTGG